MVTTKDVRAIRKNTVDRHVHTMAHWLHSKSSGVFMKPRRCLEEPILQFLPGDCELNIVVVEGAVLCNVQQKYCTAKGIHIGQQPS